MTPKKRRSGCPVGVSLDLLGDRWTLLIVRDLMVRGLRTYSEFLSSGEGIATNVLADRLKKLEAAQLVECETEESDGRKGIYRLTERGIDLAPVLLELLIWGTRHEETGAPEGFAETLERDRDKILSEARRRWVERDATPLLPRFKSGQAIQRSSKRK